MTIGIVIGTGPSLNESAPLVHRLGEEGALLFGCNNTFHDFDLNVWLSCDPTWHDYYGPIHLPHTDQWHWNRSICEAGGYRYVEGVWVDGLWMADKTKISLNHCSGAQLLNLACNQYECDTVLLVGHDFSYLEGRPRHYFTGLSDVAGEYPSRLRKYSKFIKNNGTDDLLAVYKRISQTPGLPRIINCTPGSLLPWFPMGDLNDYLRSE